MLTRRRNRYKRYLHRSIYFCPVDFLRLLPGSPEWEKEISLDKKTGILSSKSIRISKAGIEWDGVVWALNRITSLKWCHSYRNSKDASWKEWQSYTNMHCIVLGDGKATVKIFIHNGNLYLDAIGCIVKAIGLRLVGEYCRNLEEGKAYRFGDAYLVDQGMLLPKIDLLGGQRLVYCPWKDIRFSRWVMKLKIKSFSKRSTGVTLRYRDVENVSMLANALNLLKNQHAFKMGDLLNAEAGLETKMTLRAIVKPYGIRSLPGELDGVDRAFVLSAIESSQMGKYVKVRAMDLRLRLLQVAIAIFVILYVEYIFVDIFAISLIDLFRNLIPFLADSKPGTDI